MNANPTRLTPRVLETLSTPPIDEQVREAVEKLLALRALTEATGTKTTRTQNDILQALPDEVLVRVAVQLKERVKNQ